MTTSACSFSLVCLLISNGFWFTCHILVTRSMVVTFFCNNFRWCLSRQFENSMLVFYFNQSIQLQSMLVFYFNQCFSCRRFNALRQYLMTRAFDMQFYAISKQHTVSWPAQYLDWSRRIVS